MSGKRYQKNSDRVQQITYYHDRMTASQIAQKMGISVGHVHQIAKQHNIKLKTANHKYCDTTHCALTTGELDERCRQMAIEAGTWSECVVRQATEEEREEFKIGH